MSEKRKQLSNTVSIRSESYRDHSPRRSSQLKRSSQAGSALWTVLFFGALGALAVVGFQNDWIDVESPFARPPQSSSIDQTEELPQNITEEKSDKSSDDSESEVDWRSFCSSIGSFAETAMERRQEGLSMATMMEVVAASETESTRNILEEVIIEAYDRPRYSTERHQQQSIEKLRDEMYLDCVTTFRD